MVNCLSPIGIHKIISSVSAIRFTVIVALPKKEVHTKSTCDSCFFKSSVCVSFFLILGLG